MMKRKPVIGVTSSLIDDRITVHKSNIYAISDAGGAAFVLPNSSDRSTVLQLASMMDGLLLTGGGDIDPDLFGEEPHPMLGEITPERDAFETAMIEEMLRLDKPILGLCRGCQMLNVAIGGDMYQDIYSQHEGNLLQHKQNAPVRHGSHWIEIEEHSLLHRIMNERRIRVNSFHHQAVRNIGSGFTASAVSGDGIIEAIESKRHRFALGVQWHPEHMTTSDPHSGKLFQAFVDACGK
ncbi:gamma-glutamyl-gamma-aminobutyrate hydrolase family protein [Paenibacillus thermotolerans]|uniref:gamma-glutamyl-gamma-aminobutyrate hydrolase family protein n=1 Tax=Paenibacillus thermotolerans TaxID=3027807 RepID=UPI0023685EE8|nr:MULTISPECIES: gamma-glutamyl-gamma-aminobutyrate hydrolase family protein [unclassified Paenibacillus]